MSKRLNMYFDVLILFPDEWAGFSPSLLNTWRVLGESNLSVKVVCFDTKEYRHIPASCDSIFVPKYIKKALGKQIFVVFKMLLLLFASLKYRPRYVIGFDMAGGFTAFLLQKLFAVKYLYYSLELPPLGRWPSKYIVSWLSRLSLKQADGLIVQNELRLHYIIDMLHAANGNVFLVQNSPIVDENNNRLELSGYFNGWDSSFFELNGL